MMHFDSYNVSSPAEGCLAENVCRHSNNPWRHVVLDLLSYPCSGVDAPSRVLSAGPVGNPSGASSSCTVTVEERLENKLIALSWSDPTCGSYRGQLWRYAIATKAGICALSGQPIKRGDAVFRPRARARNAPRNRNAMILAAWIDSPCAAQ